MKKGKGKKFLWKNKGKGKQKSKSDLSKIICYTCNKPRHYAKDCFSGKRKGRHHASTAKASEEPRGKRSRESNAAEQKKKQIIIVFALTGSISNSEETWLVDSGASKHMTGYRCALTNLTEQKSSVEVEMGHGTTYSIQGIDLLHSNWILVRI